MKRFIVFFALLVFGIVLYMKNVSPCDAPVPYKIGTISPQFGLTFDNVLQDTITATNILNSAENKKLFVYSDTAHLTVNFVYDERAALDKQINQLQSQLDQKGKTLTQQTQEYQADASLFEKQLADFNATVDSYNKQGGAPSDVYQSLKDRQNQLQDQAKALNQRARELNLAAHEYNIGVSNLNQDTSKFNNEIAQKPEEGLYNGGNSTITIYFASNQKELIHTLTHEFGHALGMDHVGDPKAIMYSYTTSNITPTSEDLIELAAVCKEEPLPINWIKTFDKWLILSFLPVIQNYLNH